MDAQREPAQVGASGVEVGDQRAHRHRGRTIVCGRQRRQPVADRRQSLLGARTELIAETLALVIGGLDEPAPGRRDVSHARRVLGLQTHICDGETRRGGRGRDQLGVGQHRGVVHERGHAAILVVHERHGAIGTPGREPDGPSGFVDPGVGTGDPIGDLEAGIAERVRQSRAQCPCLVAIAEVDHESRHRRAAPQHARRQADRRGRYGDVVRPHGGAAGLGAGEARDRRERQGATDRDRACQR